MKHQHIVIVGAGLAGLVAAQQLARTGLRVTLLEARARAGGRILSEPVAGQQHRADLGPGWYWPELNPRLAELVRQFDLADYPQWAQGASLREGADGTRHTIRQSWIQQPESMRLVGGMGALVQALLARLDAVELHLETVVQSVALTPDAVTLQVIRAGQPQQLTADLVISTLPPRLLAGLQANPPWPAHEQQRWLATPTWMAGNAKFVAAYDQPFWRDAGLSGDAGSQRGPLVEIHDASDAAGQVALLFGFIGVPAPMRQQMGEAELHRLALKQLARLFGPQALAPRWTTLKDWAQDPYTAQQQDQQPLYQHPLYTPMPLPQPWAGRLVLAGTEFAPEFGGYLEGALASAHAAVAQVQDVMKEY
ncbi:flavin monoamine oxidase family protein [Silvimonas iriomotensis]|uniref:Amine oxidase domain-containing protein n=1 Tax=Silvimonas iriomotensis TaxID=449662 RepID=A0ABQ2P6U8_9NEIS|nr:FAD-dependent oxidoreductase [Silvimonas iriomotensis]GGP19687.1 hypothetical protein GCM10010970_11850 [Silvimonas iriomotensis]